MPSRAKASRATLYRKFESNQRRCHENLECVVLCQCWFSVVHIGATRSRGGESHGSNEGDDDGARFCGASHPCTPSFDKLFVIASENFFMNKIKPPLESSIKIL